MLWSDWDYYLKAIHLKGKPHTVKIAKVETAEVFNVKRKRKEVMPVLFFENAKRPMLISPPNRRTLQAIFGDDAAAAIGQPIVLDPVFEIIAGKEQFERLQELLKHPTEWNKPLPPPKVIEG